MNTKEVLARIRMLEAAAPAPQAPPKPGTKPGTKPGAPKPGTKKNPFHRPNIKPGEEPAPKACKESDDRGFFFKGKDPETDDDRARHAKGVAAAKKQDAFHAKHKLNFGSTWDDHQKAHDAEKDSMKESIKVLTAKLLD